jgi:DNA polymerase-1
MLAADFPSGIFLADFEFHPVNRKEGNPPDPVCLVVKEWTSGKTSRYWQDELRQMKQAPFPTGRDALFVAYFASAELDCFSALGWEAPQNVLDLFCEFRWLTNGSRPAGGNGLIGALMYFGLQSIAAEEKQSMRDLVLSGGPWDESDRQSILDYCEDDVVALNMLLIAMAVYLDLSRALIRGRYMAAVSKMQITGVPIDTSMLAKLAANWPALQSRIIAEIDQDYGIYDGRTFKTARWADYLQQHGIPWPRLASGQLDLSDDTFRQMARIYPRVAPVRELRATLSAMRLLDLQVGDDGRNRCLLSPFSSKTGRNQPSNKEFIFGPAVWLRGLIQPKPGWAIAYIDWSQQEFGIAAALSGDPAMMEAYLTGDPYLAFAIQAKAVPPDATKLTHAAEREQFKQCVLAVQYGMAEESLAMRIGQPVERARQLLRLHRSTYRLFWKWSDSAVDEAVLGGRLWTPFGWQIHVHGDINYRSLRNFPMQATGAEMMRLAAILMTEAGIRVCAPVHDAFLIEAPSDDIDAVVNQAQQLMREASRITLGGFELESDAKVLRYPERYMDKRGTVMWGAVMRLLDEIELLAA